MLRSLILALLLTAGAASLAGGQTLGTPVYMAPYRAFSTMEVGGMLTDPGPGFALEGAYRYGTGKFDIGIRAGILSVDRATGANDSYGLIGADVRFRVIEHSEDFPLDGSFTGGVGGRLGDSSLLYLPVGLSLGRRIEIENGISFVPYFHPVVVPTFGDSSEILVGFGFGVDFRVTRSLDLRVSGGLGDIEGVSIGLSWIK
ncbi:MAG: hypothetical protein AABY91_06010 [Gemmatimonadota bacterium]